MLLTRDQILGTKDLQTETIPIPEWGGDVIVTELPSSDAATLHEFIHVGDGEERVIDNEYLMAKLAARCLVDDQGTRLFCDDDYKLLARKHPRAVAVIGAAALKLNVLSSAAHDDAVKNSEPEASEDFISA